MVPTIFIPVTNSTNKVLGAVSVPVFEFLIGILFVFIIKKGYKGYRFGFNKPKIKLSMYILLPVIITVLVNIITSTSMNSLIHKMPVSEILVAIFSSIIGALMVGFFEEILMRGALFNFFMNAFKHSKFCILLSSIISSIIFGLMHLVNLSGGSNLGYTLYQVVYATAMGFVFSMAYIKYQSLLVPIGMHAFIDFSDFLFNFTGEPIMNGTQWVPFILTIIFIICGIGLYKTTDISNNSLGFQD